MLDKFVLQYARFKTLWAYKYGDWKKLLIEEGGESLIEVPVNITFPYYAQEMALINDTRIFLRQTVLEKVLVARQWLSQQDLDLKVYDGWRSMTLQENLFWYYMKLYTSKKFGMHEEFDKLDAFQDIKNFFESLSQSLKIQMDAANKIFVSWPSSNILCPSPHTTGGAVDVWLFKNGKPLGLGVPFDWMYENAGAFYHLKLFREQFSNDKDVCKYRNILLLAMLKAGFSCYGPEIWHFNYGNQMDSLVTKKIAQYSYIEP